MVRFSGGDGEFEDVAPTSVWGEIFVHRAAKLGLFPIYVMLGARGDPNTQSRVVTRTRSHAS